jgi:hypothetical protein
MLKPSAGLRLSEVIHVAARTQAQQLKPFFNALSAKLGHSSQLHP